VLPTIARCLIATYTEPGDLVADPMAGIGTTVPRGAGTGGR
jgi:DNA modification methylase